MDGWRLPDYAMQPTTHIAVIASSRMIPDTFFSSLASFPRVAISVTKRMVGFFHRVDNSAATCGFLSHRIIDEVGHFPLWHLFTWRGTCIMAYVKDLYSNSN